jgi:hypothetical protein
VGPGLPHPFAGVGLGLSGLGWMFGAIFFPLAYLTRLCVGLLGGLWACWLLFTFGWLRWLLFAFGVLIPGFLCRGGLAGFSGPFG